MAEQPRDIQSILAALNAAQRTTSTTPTQGQPGAPPSYPPPAGAGAPAPHSYPPPQQYQSPSGGAGGYPQPSASGNIDLNSIRPVNSGTVGFEDAIARAKQIAANAGLSSYNRPVVYANDGHRGHENRGGYSGRSSRSRSPHSRQQYREHQPNPYRDERREERNTHRGYGRDRSYSPGPRGRQQFSPRNGNGNRDRSPLRANGGGGGGGDDDHNSETMQIESSLVGLIIGRQGENLRRIEGQTGCRVQFMPSTDNGPYRHAKITGPKPRRADVRDAINRIIEDSGMSVINRGGALNSHGGGGGHGGSHGGGGGGPGSRTVGSGPDAITLEEGEDCLQIMVPDRTVGLIIGRGGETIRDLQERSGCHINITSEARSVNGLRPVNLIGSPEAAARAKDSIMEIVESDSRGEGQPPAAKKGGMRNDSYRDSSGPGGHGGHGGHGGGPDKVNDVVYVPSEAVGMIIGKGGETIREMQNSTGCKINVSQSSGPGESQREIALIGPRDSIGRAKAAIEEKVDTVRQKSSGGGGGRGRRDHDYDSYQQSSNASGQNNAQAASAPGQGQAAADGSDPYAIYGGYQNYLALWYQSLVHQQQGGGSAPPAGGAPPGA